MTPRENYSGLCRRQGYQWAPVQFSLCPSLKKQVDEAADGRSMQEFFNYPEGFQVEHTPSVKFLPQDASIWQKYYPDGLKEGSHIDLFGVGHEPGSAAAAHMSYMKHPLAGAESLEQIQAYPYPVIDTNCLADIQAAVTGIHRHGLTAAVSAECTIWERAWYIRDMTNLMVDMSMEDEKAAFLLDKITDIACTMVSIYARAGVDVIHTGDDIGMQKTIMMSLDMYRTWLKPRLSRVIAAAKKIKPDILIQYHSCGYVEPFIPDLIEAGIDILNPVQPECMDFAKLHTEYGNRLSFSGTVGTQTTMPFGSPADVRKVVLRNLGIAGRKGGLICAPTHLLEPEVPLENIKAYITACKEYSS